MRVIIIKADMYLTVHVLICKTDVKKVNFSGLI